MISLSLYIIRSPFEKLSLIPCFSFQFYHILNEWETTWYNRHMNLKVKQRIPLKIKRMGINGEGIGFHKKTLVFVPGALKGEDVFCQITAIRKNFAEAKLLSVNKASKYRVTPTCDIYETCGGCQIMHLKYSKQLEFKTDLLQQALKNMLLRGMKIIWSVRRLGWKNHSIIGPNFNFRRVNLRGRSRLVCTPKIPIIWWN